MRSCTDWGLLLVSSFVVIAGALLAPAIICAEYSGTLRELLNELERVYGYRIDVAENQALDNISNVETDGVVLSTAIRKAFSRAKVMNYSLLLDEQAKTIRIFFVDSGATSGNPNSQSSENSNTSNSTVALDTRAFEGPPPPDPLFDPTDTRPLEGPPPEPFMGLDDLRPREGPPPLENPLADPSDKRVHEGSPPTSIPFHLPAQPITSPEKDQRPKDGPPPAYIP